MVKVKPTAKASTAVLFYFGWVLYSDLLQRGEVVDEDGVKYPCGELI